MKQVIRNGIREIIVDEVPEPTVASHHVLIQPVFSLISSGTESASIHQEGVLKEVAENPSHIQKIWNAMKLQGPVRTAAEVMAKFSEYGVIGYSGAGYVVDKGAGVTDLELGQRMAYGGEGTGHCEVITTGRNLAARVPDEVPFDHACFAALGSIAMNAIRTSQISLGDRVAVIGLGLVGQLIVQLARLQGAVVLASDLRQERIELAKKLGADWGLMGGSTLNETVAEVTNGQGADIVIVAAATKSPGPCQQALEICRDRGRLVIVGAVQMSFPWEAMYLKEIQLFMARAYGPGSYDPAYEKQGRDYPISYVRWTENRNMEEFLRLCSARRINVEPLITHRYSLEDAPKAYQTVLDPTSGSLAVLLRYKTADRIGPTAYEPKRTVELNTEPLSSEKIGAALIGAGNLARWAHLPVLNKIGGLRLEAIHSASGARGKSYANRFKAQYCTTDYETVLNDPNVQLVVIASRNQYHAQQALAALRAGKHVFVEKPMCLTEPECLDLYQTVMEAGKQLTVGFNRRFAPYYVGLKKEVAKRSGPAVINCRVNSPGISGSYWMADPSIGGAILGEACHFVDLMYWLLESEPVSVMAYSLPTGKRDPIGENNLVASFRFADHSIANLTYCTVGSKTSGGERVEVYAPGLGAISEDFKVLQIKGGSLRRSHSKMWADKGYEPQMRRFVEAIREGRMPEVTVLDGVRSTIACLRMLESARSGEPLAFDLNAYRPAVEARTTSA